MKKRTKGRVREFERAAASKSVEQYRQQRQQNPQDVSAEGAAGQRKKKSRINQSRMIMTVIVVALIAVVGMSVKTVFDLRAEQKALTQANEGLLSEKSALIEELENVNDQDYIEEQARIQLKLIKPGEILYILEDGQDKGNDKETN